MDKADMDDLNEIEGAEEAHLRGSSSVNEKIDSLNKGKSSNEMHMFTVNIRSFNHSLYTSNVIFYSI